SGQNPDTRRRVALSLDDMRELTPALHAVGAVAAYSGRTSTITDGGEPERISTQLVTANLFSLLGETVQRGHGFDPSDDRLHAAGVGVTGGWLGHRRYAAAESAIGRVIRLDGVPYTIVGVMPPKFQYPTRSELWIPITPALDASGTAGRSGAASRG